MVSNPPTRLARRLGTGDAIVMGLGSMIGASVFAAIGPAAAAAGSGLMIGLAVAGVVAFCNATSSAQLAALYPASGGTYVYGRKRLGHLTGFSAGWGFVIGKSATLSVSALAFGAYAFPEAPRAAGIGAIVVVTAINFRGITRTATATRITVTLVLIALGMVVAAAVGGGTTETDNLADWGAGGAAGILEAAGLLFFAFAGYARIATLGEEIKDPARTIPRAIPTALGITLVVYAAVSATALWAVGPDVLADAAAPLAAATDAGSWSGLTPVVRVGAAIASAGALMALIAGVGRTTFAMASEGDLPRLLDKVHPTFKVPHYAEIAVAAVVIVLVALTDLRSVLGFSSFCVLFYYAVTNAAAWTLPAAQRRWPRAVSGLGFAGCVTLAVTLPGASVVVGLCVLAVGIISWRIRQTLNLANKG
ncbi:APC family permease [Candidatus Poriferisocius sp.]|uniref:APC family permease n=1 Tax=Candidatus Poriferisocius sp. TaxID=3101276 RepID=UPI003B010EE2